MADFSIRDVALTGFRVVRQHPSALVAWWLYALFGSLVFSVAFVGLAGPDFLKLMAATARPTPNLAEIMTLLARLAPASGALLVVDLALNSIVSAAMIRAVLRPGDDRFGFLRVGGDELRQFALGVLTVLAFTAVYLASTLVIGVIVRLATAADNAAGAATLLVLLLVMLGIMLVLVVRLSLAPALTFDSRRISLLGSWRLTRTWFWSLFRTYLLMIALVAVVYLLSLLLISAVGAIIKGGDAGAGVSVADMMSLKAYLSPAGLVEGLLSAGVSALIWPLIFTPPAAIYRTLSPPAAAGDAFA